MYLNISSDSDAGPLSGTFEGIESADIQLSINEEDLEPVMHCVNCGADSTENEPESGLCAGSRLEIDCATCSGTGTCQQCQGIDALACLHCAGSGLCSTRECIQGFVEIHDWQRVPLTWCNSASIYTNTERDEVTVTISVGDPRGAFVMTVYRTDDGSLRLSVPYAGMSLAHAPLTELSPGFFRIR